jgi:hypothetical protein
MAEPIDPAAHGELVRDGKVLPWRGDALVRDDLTTPG